jgi:hypothetical protein
MELKQRGEYWARRIGKFLLQPHHLFIIWGFYLLFVTNLGYFYNFKLIGVAIIPLILTSLVILALSAYRFLSEMWPKINRLNKTLLAIAAFIVLYVLKISLLYPDYSWDGQAYHLPSSVEWMKSGKIELVYVSLYSSTYPGLSELLQALWFRSTKLFGPPHNISQLLGLVILGFSVVGIGHVLRWKNSTLILGLVFTLTIPNIILQSTTAYNDLFFSSLILVGVYFALNFAKSDKPFQILNLYGIGIAGGLVASTKFTGAYFAFALFALVFFLNVKEVLKNYIHLIMSIVLGVAICFPWYMRNLKNFDNPFYPLSIGFGKITLFKGLLGTPDKAFFDYFSKKVGIQNSPIGVVKSWFWWPINHPVYDTRVGGSGLAWLGILLLILFLAVFARKNLRLRKRNLVSAEKIIIFFALVSVFIVPAGWWPRYVLFFPVIIGIFAINWIVTNFPRMEKWIFPLLVATIVETMFYLSFYAGSSSQSYLYTRDNSLPKKAIHATWDTLLQVHRGNVYSFVSPELAPLADTPSSNVYINDPGQQYFPLYGLSFQNAVFPVFTGDVEPMLPSLLRKRIGSFDELITVMNNDQKPSIFVTRNAMSFRKLIEKNPSCHDLTLKLSKTYIAKCR